MAKHHTEHLRPLREPRPKTFEQHLKSWYGVLGIFVALAVLGWKARGLFLESAEATSATVAPLRTRIESVERRTDTLDVNYSHLHEDVREMRQDFRDFASGKPLPALTPETLPTSKGQP